MSTVDNRGFLVFFDSFFATGVLVSTAVELSKLQHTKKAEPLYVCRLYSLKALVKPHRYISTQNSPRHSVNLWLLILNLFKFTRFRVMRIRAFSSLIYNNKYYSISLFYVVLLNTIILFSNCKVTKNLRHGKNHY